MRINAHPSSEILAEYVSGALPMAPGLVVSAHAEFCAECRKVLQAFETVAGLLLVESEAAAMDPRTLDATLARLDAPVSTPTKPERSSHLSDVPPVIARTGVGFRRWFGPGRWVAPVKAPRTDGWRVFLIRGPAGAKMPFHGHSGPEFTCVLSGSLHDGPDLFHRGDFIETDPQREHRIEVTNDGPCMSLIACHGPMRGGLITWLVTRLFGV